MAKPGGTAGNVGKCMEDKSDRGVDNSVKVDSNQKGVSFSNSEEPAKMTEKVLPTCKVILIRCDGLVSSGSWIGAFRGSGNHVQSGDSPGGKSLVTSDKIESEQTNNKICETDLRGPSRKQTLDPANSTQVGRTKHICHLCSKSFGNLSNLNRHTRIHTGECPHRCQLCSKSFKTRWELENHIRTHTGERPHQCQICSKSFGQLGSLNIHIRTHTGERPHQCQLCSKSFVQKGDLNVHIRTHTGELPHQCQICWKSFGQLSNLNRHIRMHNGERPHQCRYCSKSFGVSSNLNRHVRTQHEPNSSAGRKTNNHNFT